MESELFDEGFCWALPPNVNKLINKESSSELKEHKMGLFKRLMGNKKEEIKTPKGYYSLKISKLTRITNEAIEVQLDVPEALVSIFQFVPGQHLDFYLTIEGKEYRRSYSICSGKNEPLSIAVKEISNGVVSSWFNRIVKENDRLFVSSPKGNFVLNGEKKIVAVAAGSGITPILSISKAVEEKSDASLRLFFGNRTFEGIMYKSILDGLKNTKTHHFLSQEQREHTEFGRIDKEKFIKHIKSDLEILKSDAFFLCGPEELVFTLKETLILFGIPNTKIHFELFTPPQKPLKEGMPKIADYNGVSDITVIIDGEAFDFQLPARGKSILDKADAEGADVPYSCRGGVCSTCKAKIVKGSAMMDLNYALTDKEIEDGYILTCQAHPTSDELVISYDE